MVFAPLACVAIFRVKHISHILFFALILATPSAGAWQPAPVEPTGRRWAVILVGLPGDAEHEKLFRETADVWQKWLTETLDFPAEQVVRLPAMAEDKNKPQPLLTAEAIRKQLAELQHKLQPDDALWLFTLGHGNYDGKEAWFHVSGRDPSGADFGRWLSEVRCREQVIWLTHSGSGWFVKPLSRPGRIVIAATAADDESNETEFPHALATAANLPPADLDADKDEQISVAELFAGVTREVEKRFKSDNRIPTEHSQLDDNGDGRGTETLAAKDPSETAPPAKTDGDLARKTYLPLRQRAAKK